MVWSECEFLGEKKEVVKKKLKSTNEKAYTRKLSGLASGLVFYFYIKPLIEEGMMGLNKKYKLCDVFGWRIPLWRCSNKT